MSCEHANSFGAFSMALGRSAFYTRSEEQSQLISFELARASEMQKFLNTEKMSMPPFHHFTAYVPM